MGFAKRRKSNITAGKSVVVACALLVCTCVAGMSQRATAQGTQLTAPQKQEIPFTFGLGSAEFYERYGNNAASMKKFTELMQQLAAAPAAHIDSIVVTAFSTTSEQLGTVELAERRVDAIKAYIEPIIRQSQYAKPVIVAGNVVARNNVFSPDQVFTLLKKVNVTVYLNGVLMADSRRTTRATSAADEERRYLSPFGHDDQMDVFGHYKKQETTRQEPTVVLPERSQQPEQPVTAPREETFYAETETVPQQIQSVPAMQPTQRVPQGKPEMQPTETSVMTAPQPVRPTATSGTMGGLDPELQRFIDSLARAMDVQSTPAIPTAPAKPLAPHAKPTEEIVVTPPPAPVITEEEPCPEGCDPEIAALIRNMLAEEAAKQQPQTPTVVAEVPVAPKEEVLVEETPREEMVVVPLKPEKQPKPQKVKPVKAPRQPLVLDRPLVAVKTNLAYWAAVAANLEVEFYFAERWSAAVEGVYADWNMNLYKKHYAVNEISPEVRYWLGKRHGEYRGLYVGVYGHLGQFDYMFQNQETGNTGDYYGAGISFGAYLPFTKHFGMELGLRGGWVHAGNFDRYYYEAPNYVYRSSYSANYFGLTGAKVSLVYRFGLGR